MQPAGPAELVEPTLALLRLQHPQVKNTDCQSFMAQRIQHRTGWEDEALIAGLLDLHSSLRVSKAASFTLRLREIRRTTSPVRNPAGQWQTEGTALNFGGQLNHKKGGDSPSKQ